ncbi:MAG: AAA family ATPase [Steroidobacteraceae bacterium]|nr:AAA family ATPase [Steroidobacteraceae bacterium]
MTDLPALVFVDAPPIPETFNVLLYGQPKSGKSTAAATAPGPILWLNAEGPGALGFARKTAAERGTAIHEVRIDKSTDVAQTLRQVFTHVRDGHDPKPRTVVVDTIGKVRDALVAQLVVPGSKNTLQQFGQVADQLGGFVQAMRDLPVNLVILAHADVRDSDEDGRIVMPLIGGKLTETIPGEVDVVAFTSALRVDDEPRPRYFGQLIESRGRIAGDRSGALAGERGIRELDLSEWLGAYRRALAPDTSDLPWSGSGPEGPDAEAQVEGDGQAQQQTLEEAA